MAKYNKTEIFGLLRPSPSSAVQRNNSGFFYGKSPVIRVRSVSYTHLQCQWKSEGHVGVIQGTTVLVIGLGDIGTCFASKMKALGCTTIGVKRRVGEKPDCIDGLYGMEELDSLLPRADVVALSLPGNPSTYHTLNRERISLLSPNAIVLNVGRGTAVDTDALSDALYAGKIAGAALDVTDPCLLYTSGSRTEDYGCGRKRPGYRHGDRRRRRRMGNCPSCFLHEK